jgi:hypothetical protein
MTTAARTSDPSKLLWFVHPQYHKEMHECYQWKLQFSTMHAFSLSTLRKIEMVFGFTSQDWPWFLFLVSVTSQVTNLHIWHAERNMEQAEQ